MIKIDVKSHALDAVLGADRMIVNRLRVAAGAITMTAVNMVNMSLTGYQETHVSQFEMIRHGIADKE